MAFDLCFDKKLFLDTTCRCCSRFFADNVKFYKIFEEKLKSYNESVGGAAACALPAAASGGDTKEKQYELSEDIKDIMEDLIIWKLNIAPMDGLPQQLCEECFQRFKQVHAFREECLDSQKILQSYFLEEEYLLDSALLSPKANSEKSEGDSILDSLLNKAVAPRSSPKYYAQDVAGSPFSSPRLRLSPRIAELGTYMDSSSSIGTPPPLFEEIKTEPIDMETLEVMKPESEIEQPKMDKRASSQQATSDSDDDDVEDESSTPTSDENAEDTSSSDEEEHDLPQFKPKKNKPKQYSRLQCKICGQASISRQQQKKHILRFHPQEKPFECDICTSTFKSSFMLAQHKLKHNRPDTVQCQECEKYFRSQLHLQRHFKNFHLKSTYTCHICNQQFENYTQMRFQYHVRQHGEKRFTCSICAKAFHQKIHLINHERTHTNEQPFRCDFCGKAYRQQSVCQEHMKTHKDPTPFKCKHCPKAFSQRSTLRMHIQRIHNAEKNAKTSANSKQFENHSFRNF